MSLALLKQDTYDLKLTAKELEDLLAKPEYKAYKRLDYENLKQNKPELYDGVQKMDSVVSFGMDVINLFDTLMADLKRLPTQKEYIDAGLPICQRYWEENKYTHEKINGYPFTAGVKLGCMDRLARTYTSKLVELHLELTLKDLGYKVKTHPLVDAIMGVDMIVEDDKKRYFVHVTTSRFGQAGAEKTVKRKEKRGKFKVGSAWVRYGRDFEGDCILCYESTAPLNDGSTKWINGNPVFDRDYIQQYFASKRLSKAGELLNKPSKLDQFRLWARGTLKVAINL